MPAYGFLFLIGQRKACGVEMAPSVHAHKHLRVMLFSFEIKRSNCIRRVFTLLANWGRGSWRKEVAILGNKSEKDVTPSAPFQLRFDLLLKMSP